MSRDPGEAVLYENGLKTWSGGDAGLQQVLKPGLAGSFNTVTVGCAYREGGLGNMSMYGKVTDFHVYGRGLTDLEMEDITGLESWIKSRVADTVGDVPGSDPTIKINLPRTLFPQ